MGISVYDCSSVGGRIQQLRKMNGYTREQFSGKINISPDFFYEIEKERKGFFVSVLFRMAKELLETCNYTVLGDDLDFGGRVTGNPKFFYCFSKKGTNKNHYSSVSLGRILRQPHFLKIRKWFI